MIVKEGLIKRETFEKGPERGEAGRRNGQFEGHESKRSVTLAGTAVVEGRAVEDEVGEAIVNEQVVRDLVSHREDF